MKKRGILGAGVIVLLVFMWATNSIETHHAQEVHLSRDDVRRVASVQSEDEHMFKIKIPFFSIGLL